MPRLDRRDDPLAGQVLLEPAPAKPRGRVKDERFGEVGTYPEDILAEVVGAAYRYPALVNRMIG